jgi:hypothetical protein
MGSIGLPERGPGVKPVAPRVLLALTGVFVEHPVVVRIFAANQSATACRYLSDLIW